MAIHHSLNRYCPNSGKAVTTEGLTMFRGAVVGFCNPRCRDVFAAEPEKDSTARSYFLVLLAEKGIPV